MLQAMTLIAFNFSFLLSTLQILLQSLVVKYLFNLGTRAFVRLLTYRLLTYLLTYLFLFYFIIFLADLL